MSQSLGDVAQAPVSGSNTPTMKWILYGDHKMDPLRRSRIGSYMPITNWILYADHGMDPIWRSVTNVAQLLLAGVVSMFMFGGMGMVFANSELRPEPDDVTQKKHFLTILAIGMLGASLGGMMFYPFIAAAKDPLARAGLDAFWTICKSVGASGFALLTGVPMASFLDKLVDRKKVGDDK